MDFVIPATISNSSVQYKANSHCRNETTLAAVNEPRTGGRDMVTFEGVQSQIAVVDKATAGVKTLESVKKF
jgi:hypothetical protein